MWCVFNFFSSRSRNISSCFEKHRSPKMTNCVGGRYRVETRTADESFALGTVRFDDSVVKQFIALKFSKGFSSSLPLFWSPHPSVCQACSLCLLFDFHDNTRNQLYASSNWTLTHGGKSFTLGGNHRLFADFAATHRSPPPD